MGLLKPAWQGTSEEKALKAVDKETSQRNLVEIAASAPLSIVRDAAIDKLSDQAVIVDTIKEYGTLLQVNYDGTYRVEYLPNKETFNHRKDFVSRLMKKVVDQTVLVDFLLNSKDYYMQETVLENLSQQILLDLAKNGPEDIRWSAACRISDETLGNRIKGEIKQARQAKEAAAIKEKQKVCTHPSFSSFSKSHISHNSSSGCICPLCGYTKPHVLEKTESGEKCACCGYEELTDAEGKRRDRVYAQHLIDYDIARGV